MEKILEERSKNFFTIGNIAQKKGMNSESVSNYFKSMFAICDLVLYRKIKIIPKDHTERFSLLKRNSYFLYEMLDRLFSTYRETYTKTLSPARAEHIKRKLEEAFKHANVEIPKETD